MEPKPKDSKCSCQPSCKIWRETNSINAASNKIPPRSFTMANRTITTGKVCRKEFYDI